MPPESDPKRTKAAAGGGGDRFSSLPDDVIHHILSFIPSTKLVAQTSVLSKRWRNLWTQHPNLHFRTGFVFDDKPYNIVVDRCLRSFNPPFLNCFIADFRLPSSSAEYEASSHTLDRWLRFAALRSVRTLRVKTSGYMTRLDTCREFKLPSSIFLCRLSLADLFLAYCTFPLFLAVDGGGFPNLKRLHLSSVLISDDALAHLLRSCPLLEVLHLGNVEGSHVEIPNLPRLADVCIKTCKRPAVTILASNIRTIEYVGSFCLLNWAGCSSALTNARLFHPFDTPKFTRKFDDWLKVVRIVANVSRLKASSWLFTFIIPKGFFSDGPIFKNLRQFHCTASSVTSSLLCSLASGLRECPLLEELFFELISLERYRARWTEARRNAFLSTLEDELEQDRCAALKYLGNLDYSLCHLKAITIKRFVGTRNEFQLAEFLLGKAILLEEFILFDVFSREERELQKAFATIPQASSKVQLIFKG